MVKRAINPLPVMKNNDAIDPLKDLKIEEKNLDKQASEPLAGEAKSTSEEIESKPSETPSEETPPEIPEPTSEEIKPEITEPTSEEIKPEFIYATIEKKLFCVKRI